jgi:hypothetical protein
LQGGAVETPVVVDPLFIFARGCHPEGNIFLRQGEIFYEKNLTQNAVGFNYV